MPLPDQKDVTGTPVFILCGGLGTRLGGRALTGPKPMVEIGHEPILVHIMRHYRSHGFRRFVLCAGHRSDKISDYFINYAGKTTDVTIDLAEDQITLHRDNDSPDWCVTIAHTGKNVMTGARIARAAERYLDDADSFAVTYGDGLSDVDLSDELAFHRSHKRLATFLGVNPPSQFGRFELCEDGAARFEEKPIVQGSWINGGFFFFERGVLQYLTTDPDCVLEEAALAGLAADDELRMFPHTGFWSCIDTPRDHDRMCSLWEQGLAPWAKARRPFRQQLHYAES